MARTRYKHSETALPLSDLPGAALRAVLREGYTRADLRADIMAGLLVGVVALPLAMALAIAVGVPPQFGLYTAVVAGIVIALLGGSRTQVSGPTAAFVVVLAPIFTKFGLAGLLISGILGGIMLILMGVLRLGKFIEFIPHPVTTGFTAGIATVIATLQIKDLLGLKLARNPEHYLDRWRAMFEARATVAWPEILVGAVTLALLIYLPRLTKNKVPAAFGALPVAAFLGLALNKLVPHAPVATIASRFQTELHGIVVHGIPRLPPAPMWPWSAPGPNGQHFTLGFAAIQQLLASGFAVAMLGAIESLLSAVVSDGMARTRHDPDAELLAQGVGNVIVPFFGGIPATGAIARTATNIRSGARSPIAAIVHSLTVLLAILLIAPAIGYLPMAGLAALLVLVAWNMSEVKHFINIVRVAPRSDVAILITCFSLTVLFDMVVSVCAGVMLSALLFMKRMADMTKTRLITAGAPHDLPRALPEGAVAYDIAGPLFFGAAQRAMGKLGGIAQSAKVVIIRFDNVPTVDGTGLVALESALRDLSEFGTLAILCGLKSEPLALIERARILRRYPKTMLCPDSATAITAAEAHLAPPPPPETTEVSGPPPMTTGP